MKNTIFTLNTIPAAYMESLSYGLQWWRLMYERLLDKNNPPATDFIGEFIGNRQIPSTFSWPGNWHNFGTRQKSGNDGDQGKNESTTCESWIGIRQLFEQINQIGKEI